MFVVLLRKVLEEVREKGYPEATIVDFKFDEELGRWVLELHEGGAAGRDVEGLDVLATEVLVDHGADELVEVVLDTCNSAK